ncbi:MAG TPA: SPFH domain-containing protein, partial [Gemmataceae bacterium]|nr:SPFH domain-containing protein [Gemmataceae bacterium]
GVMLEVGQEGRHFLNPLIWDYEIHDIVNVPPGKCLVLTRKYGNDIPKERLAQGDVLAHDGERGIVREVKLPGSYRLNPYAYRWDVVNAVEIGADQVGVRILKVGKDPRDLPVDPKRARYVVPEGYRGVQEAEVRNGTYYLNPYVESITPIEVRSHRAELLDIEFPSRDGFNLKPQVLVEYQVQRDKAPEVLVRLTDEGILHQADSTPVQQGQNEILQKVILPHIRGYARIEGSNFDARDFIITAAGVGNDKVANTRERLQKALLAKVQPKCLELGIDIRAVLLGEMKPPADLADQISQRDLARVEQQRNTTKLGQYKEMQKLKSIEALKEQNKEKVEANTRLVVAKTQAQQNKQVEESKLKQELDNAQIKLEAAKAKATGIVAKGKSEAAVINLKNEAEVAGLRKAVQGFANVATFAQYHVLTRLAPSLREIFASDDSDFAKIFSAYMNAPASMSTKAPGALSEKLSMPKSADSVANTVLPGNGDVKK